MKTWEFRVVETRTVVCTYGVLADTREEALELAENGETEYEDENSDSLEVINRTIIGEETV